MIETASLSSNLDERIREALSSAKMALWEFNITEGVVSWTGKVTGHFYEFAQSLNGSIQQYIHLVHEDDIEQVMEVMAKASDGGGSFFNQHRVRWPDGTYHWVEGIGNVVRSGEIIKLTGTVQDITEKKRIEQEREDWRQQYELIATSAKMVVYNYDHESRIIHWSGSTEQLFGYAQHEISHIDDWEANIHPEDLQKTLDEFERALERKDVFDIKYRYKNAAGNFVHIHDKGFFLGETKIKMLGIISDITEIKEAEDALKESENRFKSMILEMSVGVGIYDITTKPMLCNQMAYDLLGMTKKQFLGQAALDPSWKVVREDGSPFAQGDFPIPRAIQLKKPVRQEVMGVYRPKKKDWVWLLVDANPIYDSDGKFVHVICTFSNISDLRNTKEKFNEKNKVLSSVASDLQAKNDRLLEFAQIVSHNLRSPVSSIVSLLQIYKDGDEVTKGEIIDHIQKVSERALSTTDELNNVLKIQQEDDVATGIIDFCELLNHTTQMQQGAILDCNASVVGDFKVAEVEHSPIYMESIFLNFLSNSLKYRSNERNCEIMVRTFIDEEQHLILEWEDNGLGIDVKANRNDLFKLGKRFHSNEDSRGVGLFLAKNQVNVMGGTISVESEVGAWTKFIINFGKIPNHEI